VAFFSWRKKLKRGADQNPEEMSFWEHLEELRWHLVRMVVAITIAAIVLFIYRVEVIGGLFMAPFRYDFVTYRLICEHVTDDFCPPAQEGGAYFVAEADTLELEGLMSLPDSMFPQESQVALDSAGAPVARMEVKTDTGYREVPIKLRVDAKKFMESGQAAGFKIKSKTGEMVSIQATSPYEQFMKAIIYAFFGGLILAFPYITWEMWRFIRPALSDREAKRVRWNVHTTSLLFFFGVAFGYFVILPTSVLFLAQFILFEEAENIWRIGDVINFELTVLFGAGLVFELPLIIYYLSLIGLVTPAFLRRYRRHSIVVLLTIAALITPSPDPFSQLLVFAPLMILYEISILISARVAKRKAKEAAEDAAQSGESKPAEAD
jgi:sec-independent protein translocase protein TatC